MRWGLYPNGGFHLRVILGALGFLVWLMVCWHFHISSPRWVGSLLMLAIATAAPSCSLSEPHHARLSLIPGIAKTKYHLRQDGPLGGGSDFFPWDIGSLGSQYSPRVRASLHLAELLPTPADLYLDISKVDASQEVLLDPSQTWNWNGASISTFDSSVSFERAEVGLIARSQLNDWLALRYGVGLRRFLFDGDIVTDANREGLNFDAAWLAPELGVTMGLPWELDLDLAYSGFNRGELSVGSAVHKPYRAVAELRRDFGRVGMALGYELDHVELERPFGGNVEFAHLRLRTFYWALELNF